MSTPDARQTTGESKTEEGAPGHGNDLAHEPDISARGLTDAPPAYESASAVEPGNDQTGSSTLLPAPTPVEEAASEESSDRGRQGQEPSETHTPMFGVEPEAHRSESFKSGHSNTDPVPNSRGANESPSIGRLDVKQNDLATKARVAGKCRCVHCRNDH